MRIVDFGLQRTEVRDVVDARLERDVDAMVANVVVDARVM